MEAIVLSNVNIITYLLDDMMNSLQHHKITKSDVLVSFTKNHREANEYRYLKLFRREINESIS